jgi:hypothetical protein
MKNINLILLLAFPLICFAQKNDSLPKPIYNILKTTPSYIFDFDNTFTIGIEHFYKANKSIQGEIGYGNSNQNLLIGLVDGGFNSDNLRYKNFDNYRTKIELKRYIRRYSRYTIPASYGALEIFGKFIKKKDYVAVGRNVSNNTPEYYEQVLALYKKNVFGSHIKYGQQFSFFDDNPNKKSKLILDIYFGLGFRVVKYNLWYEGKKENDRVNSGFSSFGQFFGSNEDTILPSATLGFKFGYIL